MIDKLFFLGYFFTGFGATVNVAKPKKGHTVAIFGLGAVGLAVSTSFLVYYVLNHLYFIRKLLMSSTLMTFWCPL